MNATSIREARPARRSAGEATGTESARRRPKVGNLAPSDHPLVHQLTEAAGRLTQAFGMGRSVGQIFAALYFSPTPLSLDDICARLGISKGGASMGVRQLEQWEAIERLWVRGDRKDYYKARDEFGRIFRRAMLDSVSRTMSSSSAYLEAIDAELQAQDRRKDALTEEEAFLRARLQKIVEFQGKARGLWESPMLQLLLK